jgi:hypothetical protein
MQTPGFVFGQRSPGHTALYGLITAKARQNVISNEADKIKSNQIIFI